MTIALTRNAGADCYTGWSATSARDAFFMEAEELNPAGQITTVMRKVKADGRDSGVVTGRSLKFDKRMDTSQLRLTWATNLRVRAHNSKGGAYCHWELQIDGKSCAKPSKIGVSMHSQNDDNDHIPAEVVGWCQGIARGPHTITVLVVRGNSNSDCYTGWSSNDYMEVWEPTSAEQAMITYMQAVGTDNPASLCCQPASPRSRRRRACVSCTMTTCALGSEDRRQLLLVTFGGVRAYYEW